MEAAAVSPHEVRVDSGGIALVGDHWPAATEMDADPKGAVLLLHGGGQRRYSWRRTGQWLAEAGWSAWSFDVRGHGDSGRSPDGDYSISTLVDDVIAIVDEIGEAAQRIGVPTLLVRGAESDIVSDDGLREMRELIPHAKAVEVGAAVT